MAGLTFTGRTGTWLGPLTTAWAMPNECKVAVVNCATCEEGFRGQQCVTDGGAPSTGRAQDHTTCWPPARSQAGKPTWPFVGWGYYSPGLACPTGYYEACTAIEGERPDWEIEFTLRPEETAVGCCPTGYSCTNRNGNTCVAVITPGTSTAVPTGTCSGSNMITKLAAFPDIITMTNSARQAVVTERPAMTLLAPMFQLNFKSSDKETETSSETSSTTSSRTFTTSTSIPGGGTGNNNSPPDLGNDNINASDTDNSSNLIASPSNNGLSTGAIAGIAVGAALAGILLAAFVACLFIQKRRRDRSNQPLPPYDGAPEVAGPGHQPSMYSKPPPLYGSELDNGWSPTEMPVGHAQGGGGYPPEMAAGQQAVAARWAEQARSPAAVPVELPAAGYAAPGQTYQAYSPYLDSPTVTQSPASAGGQGHQR
ncbi:hypothetical protein QBC35DRAFT_496843 [Podospora australis]|uniref:Uncharacterized protein n=1 Tax=Podospora australis TaxID=1536484 RepID=A0AAN6WV99_9PEZI|nr:hypothetical protein QBC35DRAFT_496843 [Podospora australis]